MNRYIIVLLVAAIIGAVSLAAWKTPVPDRQLTTGQYERVNLCVKAAVHRNEEASRRCMNDINAVLSREFSEITRISHQAAEDVSTLGSCGKIITLLAKEQFGATARATDYLEGRIKRQLDPALASCGEQLQAALDRYETSLRRSTVTLATELAQSNSGRSDGPSTVEVDVTTAEDLEKALFNLGLNGGVVTVATVFDAAAILNTRLFQNLLRRLGMLAASAFAKPTATAAGSVAAAAADGPLPIGDMFAVAGGLWTGYEIYATRAEFEREIKLAISNALPNMKRNVHRQLMERISGLQDDYQQAQDQIRVQSVEGFRANELRN